MIKGLEKRPDETPDDFMARVDLINDRLLEMQEYADCVDYEEDWLVDDEDHTIDLIKSLNFARVNIKERILDWQNREVMFGLDVDWLRRKGLVTSSEEL